MKARSHASSPPVRVSECVQRRRERTTAALLAAGARQLATRGIAPVSVEGLGAEAGVSRARFFALFSCKYSILEVIFNPAFELGLLLDVECADLLRNGSAEYSLAH